MAEENEVMKEPQQGPTRQAVPAVMKEPQRVTTKNPKKVEAGKRLAAHNHKKREEQRKEQAQLEKSGVNQYYGIEAVIALGVIGGFDYYIYQSRKGHRSHYASLPTTMLPGTKQSNKFEMD